MVHLATDRFRRSSKRRRQSSCPSQYLQRVIDVLVMTQKQLPTLQKVQRTVEIPQVDCIVGQFIDVPVWQILDETRAAAKLALYERVQQRTLEQLVDVPVERPPSSRHSKQWKFHHSLSFPTALMKCHLCGNAKYQSSRQPRRQSKFFRFTLLIEFMTCQSRCSGQFPGFRRCRKVVDVQQTQCMDKVVECQLRCHDRLPWSREHRRR